MTIMCTVCGYDNPLGRVHCVQCGTKLDLSRVVPEGTKIKGKGVVYLGKSGVKRHTVPQTIWKLLDLAVFLALVAALVLMWLESPIKDIQTGAMYALVAKEKLDAVATAVQVGAPLKTPVDFTEQEINAYINDPASPRALAYPPPSAGSFSVRIARYQIELSEGVVGLVAVGEIKVGALTKRIIIQAGGPLAGDMGQRRLNVVTASIGRLPLHRLPWGDRLASVCAEQFFRFQTYDDEWKLIQRVSGIRPGAGKVVVSVDGAKPAAK